MKKLKAFTLVETMIVIVVFCIGILVVLHWLSQTLRNKDYANTQIKSAFFAREWIELLFNLRDANYHKELPWNCIFNDKYKENKVMVLDANWNEIKNDACIWYLWSWTDTVLKVSIWSGSEYIRVETATLNEDFEQNLSWFQIYLHTWNALNDQTWFRFDYAWTEDEKTWFARYLLIKWVLDEGGKLLPTDKILKVESHVLYQRWGTTWEKVMETFIWNYEFNQDVLF